DPLHPLRVAGGAEARMRRRPHGVALGDQVHPAAPAAVTAGAVQHEQRRAAAADPGLDAGTTDRDRLLTWSHAAYYACLMGGGTLEGFPSWRLTFSEDMAMAQSDLFVGAGKFTGGTISGLFRQRAGEDRWETITKGLPEPASIQALTVLPSNRDVMFAGTQHGVYRSLDGGNSWSRPDFPAGLEVWSITVHPKNPRVIYAGTSPVGVVRSEDGGETWTRLPNAKQQTERIKMAFACRVMRIDVVPGSPDQIYAALEVAGVMRSLDGGEHWNDCSGDLVTLAEKPNLKSKIQSDSEAEGMLDAHALAVSPAAPNSVFLAVRMGVFQSDDQAGHWRDVEVGRFSPLTYARDIRVSPHD